MKPYQAMNITLQSIHVNPIFISGFITVFSLSTALPILADVKSLLDKNLSSLSVMIIWAYYVMLTTAVNKQWSSVFEMSIYLVNMSIPDVDNGGTWGSSPAI